MFVKWKRSRRRGVKLWLSEPDAEAAIAAGGKVLRTGYNRKKVSTAGPYLLVAVLTRSVRENGKPRQKTVSYLGSIREDYVSVTEQRSRFWDSVDGHLDRLALPSEQRKSIEEKLQATVPRPTEQEKAAAREEMDQILRSLSELGGQRAAMA